MRSANGALRPACSVAPDLSPCRVAPGEVCFGFVGEMPTGMKESVGSLVGFGSRRVKGDLESFKQFVESRGTCHWCLAWERRRELAVAPPRTFATVGAG